MIIMSPTLYKYLKSVFIKIINIINVTYEL